jgi:hypothetical protein
MLAIMAKHDAENPGSIPICAEQLGGRRLRLNDDQLLVPDAGQADRRGAVLRRERLGGMLNYYYRQAA